MRNDTEPTLDFCAKSLKLAQALDARELAACLICDPRLAGQLEEFAALLPGLRGTHRDDPRFAATFALGDKVTEALKIVRQYAKTSV